MDNLPTELILEIFKNLNLYDLIINCKLISKKFYKLINQLKFKELIIKNNNLRNNYWYYKYEAIDLKYTLFNCQFNFLEFKTFKENFKNLERLKLELNDQLLDLESLNQFKNLKTIEIDNTTLLNKDIYLELPDLELLRIDLSFLNKFSLKIKSNKLKFIRCYSFFGIELINKSTLLYLHCEKLKNSEQLENCEKLENNLKSFINLEILKFEDIDYLPDNLIDLIPINLKEIYVYYLFKYDPIFQIKLLSIIKNSLENQNFKLIKFYFNDIEIKLKSDIYFNDTNLNLIFNYYDQLSTNANYYTYFNYVDLKLKFNNNLPINFFDKFKLLQSLNIKHSNLYLINTELHLTNMLQKCSNLHSIYLGFNLFSQKFYQSLTKSCKLIEKFYLFDKNKLNFEFLLEFKLLNSLKLNYRLPVCLIYKLFKLKFMEEFKMGKNLATITKKKVLLNLRR